MKKPRYDSRYDIARRLTEGPTEAAAVTAVSVVVQGIDAVKGTVDKGRQVNTELAKVKAQRQRDRTAAREAKREKKAEKSPKRKTVGEAHGFTAENMAAARQAS